MLRSWDMSSLKSRVWLVLLLTPWGIFHGLFLTCFRDWDYATCYVFLMWQSFVAGTRFCLIGKNMFSLTLFSCLAKAIHFPWGIRLLWGQRKLIPLLCCSAGCWGGMWNGRINQVHAKGNPNNRSFLQCTALWLSATLKEFTLFLWCLPEQDTLPQQFEVHIPFHILHAFSQKLHRSTFFHPLSLVYLKLLHLTLDYAIWPKEITCLFS